MNKFTEIAKGGWHPEKNRGSSSSQGGGLRDRAKGLVGMGNNDPYAAQRDHQSRPLSSLRDPASFAPPPKHQAYYGPQANPPSGAAGYITAPTPASSGLGAPLTQEQIQASQQRQLAAAQAQEEEENRPPPGPYRVDTTGLSTAHLPKPPVRRPGQETPEATSLVRTKPAPPPAPSQKPKLPPRLPPRQNSHPDIHAPLPPPTYQESVQSPPAQPSQGILNQGAINRLGNAGVNVSGFGIGRTASPPVPPRNGSPATPPAPPPRTASPAQQNPLSGLQSRFSKMGTGSSQPATPEGGTTFAQKQAAFSTARNFHKNPSSVSVSEMRTAASTANNFRERHGEQVAAGWQKANGLNQKYGVVDRVNGMASGSGTASPANPPPGPVGKKPPPPPPPKKKGPAENSASPPPPVPLASKPRPT
ncbi:gmp synthase [Diplodia corticola]|uniref:Gmp synthase n=1 Tax=Diplodia corticola TaxID=236234 RepID=A0A1J9QZP5_9PEZI|nr:gmp synthase [Diplodia corticola]OJD34566.1 gmp synthase [Diplodia corticola]